MIANSLSGDMACSIARNRGCGGFGVPEWSKERIGLAFRKRRIKIVDDCRQLKRDVDSYSEANDKDAPIPMLWDFTDDLDEAA
jgi:hypothetical protein